jgi:hypothetical protein
MPKTLLRTPKKHEGVDILKRVIIKVERPQKSLTESI